MLTGPLLATRKLGDLRLEGGHKLTAASGLVSVEDHLYVVPDDGLSLGCFDARLSSPGTPRPVFADPALPEEHAARKKLKPDLESLTGVPAGAFGVKERSLLSVGSGSTENRKRGVLVPVAGGEPLVFGMGPLYAHLQERFPELNVEGLALQGDLLRLVQRGNGQGPNAIIDLDAAAFFRGAQAGEVGPEALRDVRPVELGHLNGVKLSFTDIAPTPDGHFVFTASAEDTANTYDDGKVMGSVVGRMNRDGRVECLRQLDREVKVEGVDISADGQVRLVTDADDPHRAAELFSLNDSQDFLLAPSA